MLEKYNKHILLKEIGKKGQEKIINSKVVIIGLGGLGSPIVRYLSSSGVGNFVLFDDDIIELDNLPRQNNFSEQDIDQSKIDITEKTIKILNPNAKIKSFCTKINKNYLAKTDIFVDCDYIIDASDNFQTKFLLSDFATKQEKCFVSGSFVAFQGYVAVYKTGIDKKYPCFRCFHQDIDVLDQKACYNQGVFSAGVGVLGSFMAAEILKEIIGISSSAGSVMIFDFLSNNHRRVNLQKNINCNH